MYLKAFIKYTLQGNYIPTRKHDTLIAYFVVEMFMLEM